MTTNPALDHLAYAVHVFCWALVDIHNGEFQRARANLLTSERWAAAAARETFGPPRLVRSLDAFEKELAETKPKRFVLYSPVGGVYLGNFLGLGFWSNMDAAGQDAAVTFESEAAALAFVRTWKTPPPFPVETRPVVADKDDDYASIEACVRAGLPRWSP